MSIWRLKWLLQCVSMPNRNEKLMQEASSNRKKNKKSRLNSASFKMINHFCELAIREMNRLNRSWNPIHVTIINRKEKKQIPSPAVWMIVDFYFIFIFKFYPVYNFSVKSKWRNIFLLNRTASNCYKVK